MLFIVDIDGTLADFSHRIHLVEGDKPDWAAFMDPELLAKDTPVAHAKAVLDKFRKHGYMLCFLTGRNKCVRTTTEQWLLDHMNWRGPRAEPVFMRGHDHSGIAASDYKRKQLENVYAYFGVPSHTPSIFFEDDPFVARMYRERGMVCRAPECWEFWDHGLTDELEPLWRS